MPTAHEIASAVAAAESWEKRCAIIRAVPEDFGAAQHAEVYAAIAEKAYRPDVQADFAFIAWRDEYELAPFENAYRAVCDGTDIFTQVSVDDLSRVVLTNPRSVLVFRQLLGLTPPEFGEACKVAAERFGVAEISRAAVRAAERGQVLEPQIARAVASVIDLAMTRRLFRSPSAQSRLRSKLDKPDTADGWESVHHFAVHRVPLSVLLHQRLYGGAFRQLLDATSTQRGNLLEDRVEEMFAHEGLAFLRTGPANQELIKSRFGLTVRPAPDFAVFEPPSDRLAAILECKMASDGGTARDKAARFAALRAEANRLGGIPTVAVLSGLGWQRTRDALGPVIRDTDGRVFTLATLPEMMTIEPFARLRRIAPA